MKKIDSTVHQGSLRRVADLTACIPYVNTKQSKLYVTYFFYKEFKFNNIFECAPYTTMPRSSLSGHHPVSSSFLSDHNFCAKFPHSFLFTHLLIHSSHFPRKTTMVGESQWWWKPIEIWIESQFGEQGCAMMV